MIDFKDIEPKWQMRWREAQAFQANPDPQRPKFFITAPFPYANAPLHIGHGRPYTLGDILARYKRMRGFNVLWPMAAHVTGTPVFGVARRIQDKDTKIMKEYRAHIRLYRPKKEVDAVLSTFTDATAIARFFSRNIERDFRKVGYSVDWRRKFTTDDPEYHAFVTWQFQKLKNLGYITKGAYPILYCPSCNNAVGEDDLLEGEHAKISEFVAIKFPFNDGYLVAATLRPETVYGMTNIWVNPKSTYVKIKVGEEYWYIAKPALNKLRKQGHKAIHVTEIPGSKFIGKTCTSPVDDREVLILPADFVDPENATGIVYSVPSHAPFDWAALRDLQGNVDLIRSYKLGPYATRSIQPISIITIEGYGEHPAIEIVEKMKITSQKEVEKLEEATEVLYKAEFYGGIMKDNCGPFAGGRVNEVKDDVITHLEKQNRAFRFYQPDRKPVICRCGSEVLIAVLPDQWFINYGHPEWKSQATSALEQITIFPESYRRLFEATFEWLKERPCARRRGLGTPFPFDKSWIIESLSDSTIYMSFYLIIHHLRKHGIKPSQLTRSFFDFIMLGEGEIEKVASQTKIHRSLLEELRNEVEYWYPNDLRQTAYDHITNHLSFFIFHHVAIFPEHHWPKTIVLNEFVILEGKKMSKSKGNVIPMAEIPKRYGADLFRLYISQIGDLATIIDWRDKEVVTIRRKLKRLVRILLSSAKTESTPLKSSKLNLMSRWLLSKVNTIINTATEALEQYRFRAYILDAFFKLQNHVEFYQRRMKSNESERSKVLRYVVERWLKLLSPVIPHTCEEIWERMGYISFISLESWPSIDEQFQDEEVEKAIEVLMQTIADIKEVKSLLKSKQPKTVHVYISPSWKYDALSKLQHSQKALTIKDLMPVLMADSSYRERGKDVSELVQTVVKAGGFWTFADKASEQKALSECIDLIQSETGLTVVIQDSDNPSEDPENRASRALPGRPALYLI